MALMITVFLAIMLVIGGHGQPQELDPQNPTKSVLTAVLLFNGDFINIRNLPRGNMSFIPVEIPALMPYPAFYLEESDDNVIYRQSVNVITEFDDGTVKLRTYNNFTDRSKNTPNTFDTSTLMDLDLEDFNPRPEDCALSFKLVDDGVMIGIFPGCRNRLENGQLPNYTMTITCDAFSIFDTVHGSFEATGGFFYDHHRCGGRYPYPSYLKERLADFESPCDD